MQSCTCCTSVTDSVLRNLGVATRKEMSDAKLPLRYRDSCAHLLIPLNRCRFEEYYMPWKCQVRPRSKAVGDLLLTIVKDERHSYEKCQYLEFKKRVAQQEELRSQEPGKRFN